MLVIAWNVGVYVICCVVAIATAEDALLMDVSHVMTALVISIV
jgi:hypothetical protein